MKKIMIDNVSIEEIKETLTQKLNEYAESRKRNVENKLESPAYAAILVEKYADGLCEAVRLLVFDQWHFNLESEVLCKEIDPEYRKNLQYRNSKFTSIEFTGRTVVSEG
jgi:hypothetical protein